ncbi:MAG: FtsX-like permease family protein [Candidatus Bathyarchaeia archaeon]
MDVNDILSYAFGAIKLRKLRAALTTLGVIIGIAAIVALLSFSQGLQDTITVQLQKGFATKTLIVSPKGGLGGGDTSIPLFVSDTQTIEAIENVSTAVAIMQKTCFINASGKTFTVNIVGVNFTKYETIYESTFVAAEGNITSENDSVVIGARIHDPWQNGTIIADVGDTVEITWTKRSDTSPPQNKTYTGQITAVLKEIGGFNIGGPSDLGIYIPISQAQDFFETNECSAIIVLLKDDDKATIDGVSEAIKTAFNNQVSVTSATAVLDIISAVFANVDFFLAGIAGISLLVAGVGIMNIMIVSLMERTREIGILKALGMKNQTVLMIFLSEAIIIGLMGSAIGIASGWGLANMVARVGIFGGRIQSGNQAATATTQISITPVLTPTVFLGAFAFGIIVSVIFAIYPAWRASKLKPVEALRYE